MDGDFRCRGRERIRGFTEMTTITMLYFMFLGVYLRRLGIGAKDWLILVVSFAIIVGLQNGK